MRQRPELEVADPIVAFAGAGLELTARATLVPGTNWAQLRVQGEFARQPRFTRKAKVRSTESVKIEGAAPATLPSGQLVEIDLPDERSERWQHLVTAPLGQPVLLNALPDPDTPGRALTLVAVVHVAE